MKVTGQLGGDFYFTDCLLFGAIVSATDPGMLDSYFFHHFTYILICFELWGRGEESLKPLQVPSF